MPSEQSTSTKSIIDIENEHSFKTIEEFRQAFRDKSLSPDPEVDFPRDQRKQLERLKKFDSSVDTNKPITRKIEGIVRQPVYVTENGKRVIKDSLIYHTLIEGYNFSDIGINASPSYGYYLRPYLVFSPTDHNRPFDPITGEKVGKYHNNGNIWEHTIFLPEKREARIKFLNDLLAEWPETFLEELQSGAHLLYRTPNGQNSHSSQRHSVHNWKNFTELSIEQLGELVSKAYYVDDKKTLRDKDQNMVEFDRSTKKVTAIQ